MDKVITYGVADNFIGRLADFIHREFYCSGLDGGRIACVFGGRRPALFLRKALAQKLGNSFIPPRIFTMDEFMEYLVAGDKPFRRISELDAGYSIYNIARKNAPGFLNVNKSFTDFMPWAVEILSFIDQLDIEAISPKSLEHVEQSAQIGYDVPENINEMLKHISLIRQKYHQELAESGLYSRGTTYLEAVKRINEHIPDGFDKIIFCNLFYLNASEKSIIKEIQRNDRAICVFQGSQEQWPVLKDNAELLGHAIRPAGRDEAVGEHPRGPAAAGNTNQTGNCRIKLFHGPDMHAQVCLVREIIRELKDKTDTVIVVPRSEAIIPLVSEVASELDEFNISMGYSLQRSMLYALFELLYKVQETKKGDKYYTADYLNLLRHPLVKNLGIDRDFAATRVVIHKLEESLRGVGDADTAITGNIFLTPAEIEADQELHKLASDTLNHMGLSVSTDDCAEIIRALHKILLEAWLGVSTFGGFGRTLMTFIDILTNKSMVGAYSINIKIMERLYSIAEEMTHCSFRDEPFSPSDIWSIFLRKMEGEVVSFAGSPLRGTQILGFLETRALNFKNVIVMDANESVLPKLKLTETLIPREVMLSLGLNRLAREEEIQRYYFKRLISGAKNVYLVYEENRRKEKSRFIEEIIWEKQKQAGKIEVIRPAQAGFSMTTLAQEQIIRKTPGMVEYLKQQTYSPSRLDKYLNCPLSFYYRYVLGLDETDNLLEDPDAAQVGTFFHQLLEKGYQRFLNRQPVIDGEFAEYLTGLMDAKFEQELKPRMKADWFLLKTVMDARLKDFLANEKERSSDISKLMALESDNYDELETVTGKVRFNYRVDRIDQLKNNSLLVIDYKTGMVDNKNPKGYKKLSEMEFMDYEPRKLSGPSRCSGTRESIRDTVRSFQLPIYTYFTAKKYPDFKVNSALYSLRNQKQVNFISGKDAEHYQDILRICHKAVEFILAEIFNPAVPFRPDKTDEHKCGYCPFRGLCA